jgi:hypothetical protein
VARHIFQACLVWIHTQSNITNNLSTSWEQAVSSANTSCWQLNCRDSIATSQQNKLLSNKPPFQLLSLNMHCFFITCGRSFNAGCHFVMWNLAVKLLQVI